MSNTDDEMVSSDPEQAEDGDEGEEVEELDDLYPLKKTWTYDLTKFFLQTYYKFMDEIGPCKQFRNKRKLFIYISELIKTNYDVELTEEQISNRLKTLYAKRKRIKATKKKRQNYDQAVVRKVAGNPLSDIDGTQDANGLKYSSSGFEFNSQMEKIEAKGSRIDSRSMSRNSTMKKRTSIPPLLEDLYPVKKPVKYEPPPPSKYQQPSPSKYQQPSPSPYQQHSISSYQEPPPQIIQISLPRQSFNTPQSKPSTSSGYDRPAEPNCDDERSLAEVIRKTMLEIDDRKALRMKEKMDFLRELFSNK